MTVKLGDVIADVRGGRKKPPTTAHLAAQRFYMKHMRTNKRGPSLVERAATLKSPFSIAEFLKMIEKLPLKQKQLRQLRETCRVRLAELKGEVP